MKYCERDLHAYQVHVDPSSDGEVVRKAAGPNLVVDRVEMISLGGARSTSTLR